MTVLTEPEIAALWVQEGGPPNVAKLMAAIAVQCESGGNTEAVSVDGCTGIFQICPPGPQSKNPIVNTREAIAKYRERGFEPWTCCSGCAGNLVAGRGGSSLATAGLAGPTTTDVGLFGFPGVAGDENALESLIGSNPLGSAASAYSAIGVIGKTIAFLTSKDAWLRIGKVLLGGFLLLVGVLGMANISAGGAGGTFVEGGKKAAEGAAAVGIAA